jgi:hypothetical protein
MTIENETKRDDLEGITFECTDCGERVWESAQGYHYCMARVEEDDCE